MEKMDGEDGWRRWMEEMDGGDGWRRWMEEEEEWIEVGEMSYSTG